MTNAYLALRRGDEDGWNGVLVHVLHVPPIALIAHF